MTQASDIITVSHARFRNKILYAQDVPPLILIAAIVLSALILNQWARLDWDMPIATVAGISCACFGLAMFYAVAKLNPVFREIGLYMGLWLLYPLFGTELTYIATSAGFGLQDKLFLACDAAMAFHWNALMRFTLAHPLLLWMQSMAYLSHVLQPPLSVMIFAIWGPRNRNSEFLTSILIGLCCTIAIYTVLPTLGPAEMFGVNAEQNSIIHALRSGHAGPYHFAGIISFPSFHVVMAALFTAAHRGNRVTFPIVLAVNLVMVTATPILGDHYLSDVIAGGAIALVSFVATRKLYHWLGESKETGMTSPFEAALLPAKS